MRVSFLWSRPSGYFDACTRELVQRGHEVSAIFRSSLPHAALNDEALLGDTHLERRDYWSKPPSVANTRKWIRETNPEVIVVSSWGIVPYLNAAIRMSKGEYVRVIAVDTPWRRTLKQSAGLITHRPLARAFDAAWIAGAPSWEMVRRLGFEPNQIVDHLYCCDSGLFQPKSTPERRMDGPFLFVGQLVERKGVHQLVKAYQRYRELSPHPRALRVIGSGPASVAGPGIEHIEFLQPELLPAQMDECFALIHPASVEHWGVVLHEAATLALPIVSTRAVGAASRFVLDGLSGYFTSPEPDHIAQTLLAMDRLSEAEYCSMSAASRSLGAGVDLEAWALNFERRLALVMVGG